MNRAGPIFQLFGVYYIYTYLYLYQHLYPHLYLFQLFGVYCTAFAGLLMEVWPLGGSQPAGRPCPRRRGPGSGRPSRSSPWLRPSLRGSKCTTITSTPQLLFKRPQIPSNRDHHKALNRGTLGGAGMELWN